MIETKRSTLTVDQLEILRAKAAALDQAVEWLQGRIDSEELMTVNEILLNWMRPDGKPRKR